MILAIAYIINLISPIIFWTGVFGVWACVDQGDYYYFIIAGLFAIVGFLFGLAAYRNDIPPRWFWAKSKIDIMHNVVMIVLGYTLNFVALAFTVYLIINLIKT